MSKSKRTANLCTALLLLPFVVCTRASSDCYSYRSNVCIYILPCFCQVWHICQNFCHVFWLGFQPGTSPIGGWRSGYGAVLLVGRSGDQFPVVSLDFSVTYSFRPHHGPGVDSAPSENEYQEHFLGVKAAHHLHVPNVMKIWEPKPPGTFWVTLDLLRDSFTFTSPIEVGNFTASADTLIVI